MELTKKQKDDLYNSHIGVGFIAYKSDKNEIHSFEFYVDSKNRVRFLTDSLHSPEVNINENIILNCIYALKKEKDD